LSPEIRIEKTNIGEKSNYTYLNINQNLFNMKKTIIGSIVGALIIFIWQFLSFALLNFHKPAQQYTEKQDAIMSFLESQGLKEGGYFMPGVPETASQSEAQEVMKASDSKPWARIEYHNKAENSTNAMVMNMVRGFLVNVVIVFLFCWLIGKITNPGFGIILGGALAIGIIGFLNQPYTGFIWYKSFDIWASFLDAIVMWGLSGIWLGWWLRRGRPQLSTVRIGERDKELA
jgi:magnesium-transporting ATPase (P-type)